MDKKVVGASSLKVGGYVIFDNVACKVSSIDISRTGKHGHAKARIAAISLMDGTKKVKLYPGHDKVEVPIIEKETAQVLSVSGDKANVMDMKTYETFDLNIPPELQGQTKEGDQVTYWIILGEKVLKQK
ncbi:translation initiation factor IF-5A [Candidatus Woesearchaeota archaeon]|jgi:translation initiation factor 5A|nr:translation initiation factor IF-5A [Candidatus Woesearchaeota archaeon]MBT4322209.1 translation initiation factor IF-5A [Candidatus Woesearchaeota archaeon]